MKKILPFLWFNNNVEEAINFYTSIFKNTKVIDVSRMGNGTVMSATLEIEGQEFIAFNGGPHYKFSEAMSFFVSCETQEEIDNLWEKLSQGGVIQRCGWLKDQFGLSWQIIPPILGELLRDKDRDKSKRVMDAMMKMEKIDIGLLRAAHDGK